MSEMDDLRAQLAEVRVLAAHADREVSEVQVAFRGFRRTQQALRETQLEQGRVLEEHDRTLRRIADTVGDLVIGQARHERVLGEHSATLDRHTQILDQHTQTLDQHTQTLDQHTQTLDQHTQTLDQQTGMLSALAIGQSRQDGVLAEILRRLPPVD